MRSGRTYDHHVCGIDSILPSWSCESLIFGGIKVGRVASTFALFCASRVVDQEHERKSQGREAKHGRAT
jgi:hypothetical protein